MRFRNGKGLMYVRVVVWVPLSAAPISMHLDSSSLLGRLNSSSRQSSVVSRRIFGLKMEVQPERLGARDPCSTFRCYLIQSPIRLPAS